MSRPEKEILERLGTDGLSRVLADLLDQNRLVRLANTCGLKYPGMRTRSQSRDRILADLVQRASHAATARKAIFRALQKETRVASREWAALNAEEKQSRLADDNLLRSNGELGRHLFLLASSEAKEDQSGLSDLLTREKSLRETDKPEPASKEPVRPSREETRLKRRITELQKKLKHLEGQLTKSREAEKSFKRDLIQRKGELAESRMLAERLRNDLEKAEQRARRAVDGGKPPAPTGQSVEQLAKAVRRLAGEQKKLAHGIEKLGGPPPPPVAEDALDPVLKAVAALQKEVAALRRERKREVEQQTKRLNELRSCLDAPQGGAAGATRQRAARPLAGNERVGVFIDVQNMYYGARQLKGKLDFDALMEAAVRDRRLIQATAYVVESSEIDQTGFIAILQKRAIQVRRKTLKVRADGSMKGDWDMELALDVLDTAPGLDVIVLVSGDGDFTSLVQRVKRIGPRVEVIGFPRNTAKSLLEAADQFQPLNRKFMIYADGGKTGAARKRTGSKKKPSASKARDPQ
jgi:uncharacterized LabA/DUF88 family protein